MVFLGTRFGTTDATQLGTGGAGVLGYLYALTNFTAANFYATQAAGGESGVMGFGVISIFRLASMVAASRIVTAKIDIAAASGWQQFIRATHDIGASFRNTSGYIDTPSWTTVASDVGRVHVALSYLSTTHMRHWFDRVEKGAPGTATANFVPTTTRGQEIGVRDGTSAASGLDIVETATFRGTPTDDQLRAVFNAIRATGTIPTTGLAGLTITHKWPDRAALRPPPLIRIVGATGFATTGFHVRCVITPALLSGDGYVAACSAASGLAGWSWLKRSASLMLYLGNASGVVNPVTSTIPTTWLASPHLIEFVYDGANAWQVLDGVASAPVAVAAGAFTPAVAGNPMVVGTMVGGAWPIPDAVYAVSGAHTVPTTAESRAAFETWRATGKLPRVNHASERYYDVAGDVAAAGESVPAVILDRAGTDHLTRVGALQTFPTQIPALGPSTLADVVTNASIDAMARAGSPDIVAIDLTRDGRRSFGAQGFSTANYLQSAPGAGIRGHTAGFVIGGRLRYDAIPSGSQIIACNADASNGYAVQQVSASLRFFVLSAGTFTITPTYSVTAGDVGQPLYWLAQYRGGSVFLWAKRVLTGAGVAGAITVPTGTAFQVGHSTAFAQPFTSGSVFDIAGADGVALSDADVAAWFDASEQLGKPAPFTGRQRAYELTADFGPTESVTPTVQDRVGTDHLTTVGTLTLAQRTERAWSYETTPIAYGANAFGTNDHYTHADALRVIGNAYSFVCLWRVDTQSVAAGVKVFLGDGAASWCLYTNGANQTLFLQHGSLSGAVNAPIVTLTAAHVGKLLITGGTWDTTDGRVRLFHSRAEVGTGSAVATVNAGTNPSWAGRSAAGQVATGITLVGWTYSTSPMPLATYQANYDAIVAAEDIVSIPGLSVGLWSLKRDRADQSAQITDRIGTKHFTRVGNPAVAPIHARAWAV